MAGDEHRRYSFAEEIEVAAAVGELAVEFVRYRPGEPRARIISSDGQRGAELSPPLAEALDVIGQLMSKGHAVVIEAVQGLLSVAETAELVRQSPERVRSAVRDGIIPVRAEDGGRISITQALLSRNHVHARRRVGLDSIADTDDSRPDDFRSSDHDVQARMRDDVELPYRPRVVLDSSSLWSRTARDLLLSSAEHDAFEPIWSTGILGETNHEDVKHRLVEVVASGRAGRGSRARGFEK